MKCRKVRKLGKVSSILLMQDTAEQADTSVQVNLERGTYFKKMGDTEKWMRNLNLRITLSTESK